MWRISSARRTGRVKSNRLAVQVARAAHAVAEGLEGRRLLSAVDFISSSLSIADAARVAVAGDFNGDGHADVAYLTSAGKPGVVPGHGDGTFEVQSSARVGFPPGSLPRCTWSPPT